MNNERPSMDNWDSDGSGYIFIFLTIIIGIVFFISLDIRGLGI